MIPVSVDGDVVRTPRELVPVDLVGQLKDLAKEMTAVKRDLQILHDKVDERASAKKKGKRQNDVVDLDSEPGPSTKKVKSGKEKEEKKKKSGKKGGKGKEKAV